MIENDAAINNVRCEISVKCMVEAEIGAEMRRKWQLEVKNTQRRENSADIMGERRGMLD